MAAVFGVCCGLLFGVFVDGYGREFLIIAGQFIDFRVAFCGFLAGRLSIVDGHNFGLGFLYEFNQNNKQKNIQR